MPRTAVLVAEDYLESNLMKKLAEQLQPTHRVVTQLSCGDTQSPALQEPLLQAVASSIFIAVCNSAFSRNELHAAACAIESGVPLVSVSLAYSSWNRSEFVWMRPHVRLLFVADEEEARLAAPLYPNARVVAVGNPEWEGLEVPPYPREEVRRMLEVTPEERLILVSGEKSFRINFPLAACLIEAVRQLENPEHYRLVFAIHPGHESHPGVNLIELYQRQLQAYEPRVRVEVSYKMAPFGIVTSSMVAGADLVAGTDSTLLIEAALQRIPALSVLLRAALGRPVPQKHRGWWAPVDRGAVAGVYDLSTTTTANLISSLLTPSGFAQMRAAQERYFKPQKSGASCAAMCEHLQML